MGYRIQGQGKMNWREEDVVRRGEGGRRVGGGRRRGGERGRKRMGGGIVKKSGKGKGARAWS